MSRQAVDQLDHRLTEEELHEVLSQLRGLSFWSDLAAGE